MLALINQLINLMISIYLAPGRMILQSFRSTSWGHDLHIPMHWALTALVALIFWCLLFNLLDAADTQVRNFINRNRKTDAR